MPSRSFAVAAFLLLASSILACSSESGEGSTGPGAGAGGDAAVDTAPRCDPDIDIHDAHPDPGWTCCPLPAGTCSDFLGGSTDRPDAPFACPEFPDYGGSYQYCIDFHGCPVAKPVPGGLCHPCKFGSTCPRDAGE
jgi:hypothetical protein